MSAARLAANRANARHSAGPRTPEGKARSRWNALVHGLRARALAPLAPRFSLDRERQGVIPASYPTVDASHTSPMLHYGCTAPPGLRRQLSYGRPVRGRRPAPERGRKSMARTLVKILLALVVAWAVILAATVLALQPWRSSRASAARDQPRYEPVAAALAADGLRTAALEADGALVGPGGGATGATGDAAVSGREHAAASLAWAFEEDGTGRTYLTCRAYGEQRLALSADAVRALSSSAQALAGLRRLVVEALVVLHGEIARQTRS